MTFDKLKETVVDKEKFATQKELVKMLINLALSILTYSLALGLAINSILGYRVLIVLLLIAVFGFLWTCDLAAENKENFKKVEKLTKFWWSGLVLTVVVYVVLRMYNFM